MSEFGRDYVSEVEASEIKAKNEKEVSAKNSRCLLVARRIEDFQTARSLGITLTELNHGGVYQ